MTQEDFFIRAYPLRPGHKQTDTSLEAAVAIDSEASTLRASALLTLYQASLTADEIAQELCRSVLAIRPRITELKRQGKIIDSGKRRPNKSGKKAIVWKLNKGEE